MQRRFRDAVVSVGSPALWTHVRCYAGAAQPSRYDPDTRFFRSDVLRFIDEVERAIDLFEAVPAATRRPFSVHVLLRPAAAEEEQPFSRVLPLEEAAEAVEALSSRSVLGRWALTPGL